MIFIDAFSQAYFSKKYTPFIYSLAENGTSYTLDPIFAYRGIDTTIFTGVWPSVHNVWTEFKLAGNTRPRNKDRIMQTLIRFLDILPTDGVRAKSRFFVERYIFKKFYKTLNVMPPAALPYFESSQLKETFEQRAVNQTTTIFDVFRRKGVRYVCIEPWIRGDKGVLDKAKKVIHHHDGHDFLYIKFSHLDHLGHKFGPEPSTFQDQLTRIDKYAEEVVTLLQRKNQSINVIIIADHGMSKVHKTVNILKELRQMRSQIYEDYIVFADSTMIRFWFFNEKAACEIFDLLNQFKCGHILSKPEKELLKIPLDPHFGETIFVLDEGYLLHPSFFNSTSEMKGMHGYAYPKTREAFPILVMNGEITKTIYANRRVDFIDIPHSILQCLFPDAMQTGSGLSDYLA